MRKPFILKLIIANMFMAPLGTYFGSPQINPLQLAFVTAICIPIAIGLHTLNPKARIATICIAYLGAAVHGTMVLLLPTLAARALSAALLALDLFTAWYMHRLDTRYLFDPVGTQDAAYGPSPSHDKRRSS